MVKLGAGNVQSEDDIQGNQKPLPGRYHAVVKDVKYQMKGTDKKWIDLEEEDSDSAERIRFTFQVLAGTVPGQEDREFQDDFYLSEKAIPRIQRFALCVGLLRPGEVDKEVLFSHSIGQQLVVEVDEEEYKTEDGKTGKKTKMTWMGMWSLNNKAVEDVPRNRDALSLIPDLGGQEGNGNESGGKQQAVTANATTAGDNDKWANL